MTSETKPDIDIDTQISGVVTSLSEITDRLSQYVYQRLTTKQHEALTVTLTSVSATLRDIQTRLKMTSSHPATGLVHASDSSGDEERERFSTLTSGIDSSCDVIDFEKDLFNNQVGEILKLRAENSRLADEKKELELELHVTKQQHDKLLDNSFSALSVASSNNGGVNTSIEFIQTAQELSRCKEMLRVMKGDRSKLKEEILDLHVQMKQLYCTLGDKEAELRDFIRNYDQHKKDNQERIKKVLRHNLWSL
jgi:vacuolar-type H+-ATPase subunit D/Vma8